MTWRRVYKACTRVISNVFTIEKRNRESIILSLKRMQTFRIFIWNELGQPPKFINFRCLHNIFNELIGQNKFIAGLRPIIMRSRNYFKYTIGNFR